MSGQASQNPEKGKKAVAGPSKKPGSGSSPPVSQPDRGRQPASGSGPSSGTGTSASGGHSRSSSIASKASKVTVIHWPAGTRETSESPPEAEEEEDVEVVELSEKQKENLAVIKRRIDDHPFTKSSEQEAVFFEDPRFGPDDLVRALDYVYESAVEKAEEYELWLSEAELEKKGGEISLRHFATAKGGDVDPANVIKLEEILANKQDFNVFTNNPRLPRTIVVLARLFKKAEKASRDAESDAETSLHRYEQLQAWVKHPDRLDAKPRAHYKFLRGAGSNFTQEDLLDAALYAKRQQRKWIARYDKFRGKALQQYKEDQLLNMKILPRKVILKDQDNIPDLVNFVRMKDEDIKAIGLAEIEDEESLSDATTETSDASKALTSKENERRLKQEAAEAKAREDVQKLHKNLPWSLAICAKYGRVMEKAYREAVEQLPQFAVT